MRHTPCGQDIFSSTIERDFIALAGILPWEAVTSQLDFGDLDPKVKVTNQGKRGFRVEVITGGDIGILCHQTCRDTSLRLLN